jgi:hypothetical protein
MSDTDGSDEVVRRGRRRVAGKGTTRSPAARQESLEPPDSVPSRVAGRGGAREKPSAKSETPKGGGSAAGSKPIPSGPAAGEQAVGRKRSGKKKASQRGSEVTATSAPGDAAAVQVAGRARDRSVGQVAAERARFELGPVARVLEDELGTPPPGYGLTIVRGFVRDPHHVVATWDVNDRGALVLADERSWSSLELRIMTEDGETVKSVLVGSRSGVWHESVPRSGLTLVLAIGFVRGASFEEIARSAPVRLPPADPQPDAPSPRRVSIPPDEDLRRMMRGETPVSAGHTPLRAALHAADRLLGRLDYIRRHGRPLNDQGAAGRHDEPATGIERGRGSAATAGQSAVSSGRPGAGAARSVRPDPVRGPDDARRSTSAPSGGEEGARDGSGRRPRAQGLPSSPRGRFPARGFESGRGRD